MDIPIDPALLAEGDGLADMIAGVEGHTLNEAAEEVVFDSIMHSGFDSEDSIFNANGLEYVKILSSINVVRTGHQAGQTLLQSSLKSFAGNSRDPPTAFMYKCKNSPNGCVHTTHLPSRLERHEIVCQFTSSKPTTPPPPFPCSDCPKGYQSKGDLNRHVKRVHASWVPRSCPTKTCDPGRIFETKEDYNLHQRKYHHSVNTDFKPTRCSYPGCVYDKVHKTYSALKDHLLTVHKLNADQRKAYLPFFKKKPFVARTCPVPCENPTVYKHPSDLKKHLQSKAHTFSDAEVESYLIQ